MIAIKIIKTINAREITAVFLFMNFLTNSLNLLCALGSSSAAARLIFDVVSVSYTHLDVYKRQGTRQSSQLSSFSVFITVSA